MEQEAIWIKCNGEAHSPAVAGRIDHCGICMPWWEQYPICPDCKKRLPSNGLCKDCRKSYKV